jgi:glycosyltransferase involved in cell wall biosynthesis
MKVSVIICTYNRAAMLEAALRSLVQVELSPAVRWEIVIVDNNSTDGTADVVRRWEAECAIPVVGVHETQQGRSFALNRGIAAAHGEILVFTDDDVTFDRAWLGRLVEPFARPDVMGVGGRIEPVWSCPVPTWWASTGPYALHAAIVFFDLGPEPGDITSRAPFGANLAFRRVVFERHGGFRESLGRTDRGLMGGEDTEFVQRVMRAGDRVVYAPAALVYHPVEPARARKAYFRRWYFDFGRTRARWEGRSPACVYWFGVPRFMIRQLAEATGRAAGNVLSRHAFYWQLQMLQTTGMVYEFWRTRHQIGPTVARVARTS